MSKVKSCYIHIPFCNNICSYCDFCKFYYQETLVDNYLIALKNEIEANYENDILDTIYIGGGTPSSLNINQLDKLFDIIKIFKKSSNLEFTIECNIQDITIEKLLLFKKNGINRISIGIESFNKKILSFLERNYQKQDILDKLKLTKSLFSNINIDLMYAISNQTLDMLKQDIELFLKLDVPHISIYSLIIEDNTKLKINNTSYISEDIDSAMYELIEKKLTKKGYIHYEISNYALPGYESRHNMTYWQNKRYYGFGISASGYIDNYRYTNTKNFKKYLSGNYYQDKETLTSDIDASNYAILGLRTLNGINKKIFLNKFKEDFISYFKIKDLLDNNIIINTKNTYYLNPKYWYISNEILIKFI